MNYYSNNINHTKGDTFSFMLYVESLGQDLDSVYFTCRASLNEDSEVLFEKSLENGITMVDYDSENDIRTYAVRVPPADTKNIQQGTYYYDCQVGVNGDIFTVMKGKFILEQETARRE